MNRPKITPKQTEILNLLATHRFLSRAQIQQFLGHKDHHRINVWLKDLRQKQYIQWIYSTDFYEKSKPAMYFLDSNGLRYLKQNGSYSGAEIRQRYGDKNRSKTFIDHCLCVAECCLVLKHDSNADTQYSFVTKTEYEKEDSGYAFLEDSKPDLLYTRQMRSAKNPGYTNYLLEIFDSTLPRYRINKRLKNYVKFVSEGSWEAEMDELLPPTILLVCPTLDDMIRIKRRLKLLLADMWDEDRARIHIKCTTLQELRDDGVNGSIWETV